jgi:hypothetical protein
MVSSQPTFKWTLVTNVLATTPKFKLPRHIILGQTIRHQGHAIQKNPI